MTSRKRNILIAVLVIVAVLFLVVVFVGFRYLDRSTRQSSRPAIHVITPGLNETIQVGQAIPVQVGAVAHRLPVILLQFYADGILTGEQQGQTDNLVGMWGWSPSTDGIHTLHFVAYNQKGEASVVSIAVTALPLSDQDGDGVPDAQDNCPDQAGAVTNHGCILPSDRDSDGVSDDQDICPELPGLLEYQGCPADARPDYDRDGIVDELDHCPDEPGLPEWLGCPATAWSLDRDGDGTPDFLDHCVIEAGTVEDGGCPHITPEDSDGDGTADSSDACAEDPGPSETGGCPIEGDRDGDGIADASDLCPDTPGFIDGCLSEGWDTDGDGDGVIDIVDVRGDLAGDILHFGDILPNDRDGDGVFDDEDSCPDLAGSDENHGCPFLLLDLDFLSLQDALFPELLRFLNPCEVSPESCDRDRDGLSGEEDFCPEEAGPASNEGCPVFAFDQDGDGVLDEVDACITEAGDPATLGCPDAQDLDRDGISSDLDACPDIAGMGVSTRGCPATDPETTVPIEFYLLALNTDPSWSNVYCYVTVPPGTTYRLPISGNLSPIGYGYWNLPVSRLSISAKVSGAVTFNVRCYGATDDPSAFPVSFGAISRWHTIADWDSQIRQARALGEGGWFQVSYQICRSGCP